jgi:arylsulfatase A-like enzyme
MRQDRKAKGAPARNPGMPFGPKKRVNKFNQWFPKVAIVKDHWKLHKDLFYEGNDELYHLKEDPGEQKDLYDTAIGRTALADLETELKAYLDSRKDVGSKGEIPKSDPSTLRDLKSLGYVQ